MTQYSGMWTTTQQMQAKANSNWPETTPGAPTSVSATAGDTQASVSFTAPSDIGGSAITGYRVTSTPGSITATGSSSPITITGLTNGVEYTFTVAAQNAFGYGPESAASNAVTPEAPIPPDSVEYLIVAGGGGGGAVRAGGGGAGGYRAASGLSVTAGVQYTVTVGAGGTKWTYPSAAPGDVTGGSSSFNSITSLGGGLGGGRSPSRNGTNGGSGGGGQGDGAGSQAGQGTTGQGNNGGTSSGNFGSGGGGAGAAGDNAGSSVPTNGGIGIQTSISGTATYYAGGGGGGDYNSNTTSQGGLGGGGNGGPNGNNGSNGTNNTGGGGGGGADDRSGGNGGSGIVIIRYSDTYDAATATTGSPTVTVAGGYRVYKFTGTGSITF